MRLHRPQDAAQHVTGAVDGGFVHHHWLKAPGHGRVFLEILGVFHPCRSADGAQGAARQRRFQQVCGIASARRPARAHQGVNFVNEQDDRCGRILHLINHAAQALFKLTLHGCARLHQPKVQHEQLGALQFGRHLVRRQPLGKALDHGGFAHACLARQDRVVLPAAQQDVDDLPDLIVAANDRVHLASRGLRRHIDREPAQGGAALTGRGRRARGLADARPIHRAHVIFVTVGPGGARLIRQGIDVDLAEHL